MFPPKRDTSFDISTCRPKVLRNSLQRPLAAQTNPKINTKWGEGLFFRVGLDVPFAFQGPPNMKNKLQT